MISSLLIIRTFLVAWRSGAGLRSDSMENHHCRQINRWAIACARRVWNYLQEGTKDG
jgi:hypothetical protein